MKMKRFVMTLSVGGFCLAATSCGGSGGGSNQSDEPTDTPGTATQSGYAPAELGVPNDNVLSYEYDKYPEPRPDAIVDHYHFAQKMTFRRDGSVALEHRAESHYTDNTCYTTTSKGTARYKYLKTGDNTADVEITDVVYDSPAMGISSTYINLTFIGTHAANIVVTTFYNSDAPSVVRGSVIFQ